MSTMSSTEPQSTPETAAPAPRVLAARVRWSWLNGPAVLGLVMLYVLAGLPLGFAGLLITTGSKALAAIVALLPFLAFIVAQVHSMELRAGTDGVLLRWFGTTRFHSYQDIRRCVLLDDSGTETGNDGTILRLELRSGRTVELRSGGLGLDGGRFENGVWLVDWITRCIETAASSAPPESATALERGERPIPAWLADLAQRAQGRGYRGAALDREDLLQVVESTAAAPTARVGAAALLRKTGLQDEERGRLRVVAETSVSPRLRIALEAAADAGVEEDAFDERVARAAREPR